MPKATEPLLDVDTLAPERQTVRIRTPKNRRGKLYEIVNMHPVEGDLGMKERADLMRLQKRVQELDPQRALEGGEQADEDALASFEQVIDEFLALAFLGLEPDVIELLKLGQKEALMGAFIEASPEVKTAIEAEAAKATAGKRTPASSSRRSKSSTADTRKRGSSSRRRS